MASDRLHLLDSRIILNALGLNRLNQSVMDSLLEEKKKIRYWNIF